MAKLTNEGENYLLDVLLSDEAKPANLYLGLYKDASEPEETATLASLTEVDTGGYARIALAQADWTLSNDLATHLQKTFTASGAAFGDVTGAFVCTVASGTAGKLLTVQHFAEARTINDGDSLAVTAKVRAA